MSRDPSVAHPPGAWPDGFAATAGDRDALLVLAHLEGLTPRQLGELARRHGSAAGCLHAIRCGAAGSDQMRGVVSGIDPSAVRAALRRAGARAVFPGEREHVAALADLPDPPASLFVRGHDLTGVLELPAVAVVGARRCSAYGREIAEAIAFAVASRAFAVVSGAALGIDAAAHRGALAAGGPTIAVLGSGIDVDHPRSNRTLIREIAERGSVVSEYPPGRPALPRQFPARNRIVASLACAVVVVEGAESSGSLITAEFALELGRDVLAVPGPVTSPLSRVPHDLIREGATLVRSAADVLDVVGAGVGWSRGEARGESASAGLEFTADERHVLDRLAGAATVDAVAASAGLPASRTLAVLSGLELRGIVRAVGGRYERTAASLPSM